MIQGILSNYRDAYSGIPKPIWWLCVVSFANRTGAMTIPFMALYLTREINLSIVEAGSLLGWFGLGAIVGGYSGGWLTSRFPPTRVQIGVLLFEASTLIFLGDLRSGLEIGIGLFLLGFFNEAFRPANASAMVQHCDEPLHARAFSLNRLAINLGASIGPVIGGFLAMRNYQWLFWANAFTCVLAAILILQFFGLESTKVTTTKDSSDQRIPRFACLKDGPFLLFLVLLVIGLFAFFQIENTFLVYLKYDYLLQENRLGLLFTVNTVLIILIEMVLVHSLQRRNPLIITGLGFALVCGGLGILPYGKSFAFAVLAMIIHTFGEMLALPFSNAWVASRGTTTTRSIYLGMYYSTFGVAIALAPVLGTRLYNWGPGVLWHTLMILGVVVFFGYLALASFVNSRPLSKGVSSM